MHLGEPGEYLVLKLPRGSPQGPRFGRADRVGAVVPGDVALAPAGVEVRRATTLLVAEEYRQKPDGER